MSEKPKKKRKYWNDYLKDVRLEATGEYSYKGHHYELEGGEGNEAIKNLVLSLLMSAFSVTGGIIPATGAMDTWYVIIPYALTVILSFFTLYYGIRWIYNGKTKLRGYVYEKTIPRILPFARAVTVTGIIAFLMEGLHLIRYGMGDYPFGAIILEVCLLMTVILSLTVYGNANGLKWLKIEE